MKAIRLYKTGLEQWKQVLIANPAFHRLPPPDHNDHGEEETYEYELAYLRLLVEHDERVRDRANLEARAAHAVVPFLTQPFPRQGAAPGEQFAPDPLWPTANRERIKWFIVQTVGDAPFSSPFVGTLTASGDPWLRDSVKASVRMKQGVQGAAVPPPSAAAPSAAP